MSWTYPKTHFDFIHIRELFGCVADWDEFFGQAFKHTKPGGYVEVVEHIVWPVADDATINEDSFLTTWGKTVFGVEERFGKSFTIWEESKKKSIEKPGFVDVVGTRYRWPMDGWPSPEHQTHGNDGDEPWQHLREWGVWNQLRVYDGVEGFMIRLLTNVGGWSYEVVQVFFLARMRAELKGLKIHAYMDVTIAHKRKPGGNPRPSTAASSTSSGYTSRPWSQLFLRIILVFLGLSEQPQEEDRMNLKIG